MDEYKRTVTYSFNKVLNDYDISDLESRLVKVDGIDSIDITKESIIIEYVTLQLAEESVKEIIKNSGYPLKEIKKKRKGIFRRFIDNLARSNKQSFGNRKLDCCDLKHKND
jgi:copper chaperone CopZ